MCAKKRTNQPRDPIQAVLDEKLPRRNRGKEERFAAMYATESPSPDETCSANECLCELIRTTLNDLSPTQKGVFSYWLLKLRSDRRPLSEQERRVLSAHTNSLIGIIGTEKFDSILSGVLTIIGQESVQH